MTPVQKQIVEMMGESPLIINIENGKTSYIIGEKTVNKRTFECLLRDEALAPANDALFGGFTQTYVRV